MSATAKTVIGLIGVVAVWLALATTLFSGIGPTGSAPSVVREIPVVGAADPSVSQTLVGSPPGQCAGASCTHP